MKAGDKVRLLRPFKGIERMPSRTRDIFDHCLDKIFEVTEVTRDGLLVLDVSAEVDAKFGGFKNDLRVEPECVKLVQPKTSSRDRR